MKGNEDRISIVASFMALLILMTMSFGCTEDEGSRTSDTPFVATAASSMNSSVQLVVDRRYWISANPTGDGRFGYFIGAPAEPGGIVENSFTAGTNVRLLVLDRDDCKVEGPDFIEGLIIEGWVPCERLVDFEPTPVPIDLYMHSP